MKRECSKPRGSTENNVKSNFLRNIYSEKVLSPYSQGVQEIPFKLHSFQMPPRLMGQWTNSTIRLTVTDEPLRHANMSKFTFDPKKKNPYWVGIFLRRKANQSLHGICLNLFTLSVISMAFQTNHYECNLNQISCVPCEYRVSTYSR